MGDLSPLMVRACGLTIGDKVKLYIVSEQDTLACNSGFIKLIASDYGTAFEKAEIGQFIHVIEKTEMMSVVSGTKKVITTWTSED